MTHRTMAALAAVVCVLGLGAAFVATPARSAGDTVSPGQTVTLPGSWGIQVLGPNTLPTQPDCANAPAQVVVDKTANGQNQGQVAVALQSCAVTFGAGFYTASYMAPGDYSAQVPWDAADGSTFQICYVPELPSGTKQVLPASRCTVVYTVSVPSPSTSSATTTAQTTTSAAPVGGAAPTAPTDTTGGTSTTSTCDATCQSLQAQIDQLKADLAELEKAFAALDAALLQDGVAVPDYTATFPSTDLVAPITVTANPTGGTANTTQGVLAVH